MTKDHDILVSVDVETSGPIPGEYSLLTIGACTIDGDDVFSCELKPLNDNADPKAMEVVGLSLENLRRTGLPPLRAMRRFSGWLDGLRIGAYSPIFVGLNAPFDWSFVNYYFHRFMGGNPFGYTALDIKAYYMGVTGCRWTEATSTAMSKALRPRNVPDHDALHDALFQAELYRLIRGRALGERGPIN